MALCPRFLTVTERCCRNSPPAGLVLLLIKRSQTPSLRGVGRSLTSGGRLCPFRQSAFRTFPAPCPGRLPPPGLSTGSSTAERTVPGTKVSPWCHPDLKAETRLPFFYPISAGGRLSFPRLPRGLPAPQGRPHSLLGLRKYSSRFYRRMVYYSLSPRVLQRGKSLSQDGSA